MWDRRSKTLLRFSLFLSGFMLVQLCCHAVQALTGWQAMRYNLIWLCTWWMHAYGFKAAEWLMNAAVLVTLVHLSAVVARQLWTSRRTYRKLKAHRYDALSSALNAKFAKERGTIMVVSHGRPIAVTLRFFRPVIVLSTGLLALLDEEELAAVVEHERFHLLHRDPLAILALYASSAVFWYIPILRWTYREFIVSREVLADLYATERAGSPRGLGSALLKLIHNMRPVRYPFVHASFAEHSINYRIRRIVDPEAAEPKLRLPVKMLLLSVAGCGMLSLSFLVSML